MNYTYTTKQTQAALAIFGIEINDQKVRYLSEKNKVMANKSGRDIRFNGYSLSEYIFNQLNIENESKDRLIIETQEGKEKIIGTISSTLDLLMNMSDFKKSFTSLSFSMSDEFVFKHIKEIAHLPHNQKNAGINSFHKSIDIEDSKNSELALQIIELGRVPNLSAIAKLKDFTDHQINLIKDLVGIFTQSFFKTLTLDGSWITIDEQDNWKIDPVKMIDTLITNSYLIVEDKKEIECVKAYQKAGKGIEKFLKELDKQGAAKVHTMLRQFPLDQLFMAEPQSETVDLSYPKLISFVRTGVVSSCGIGTTTTPLSEQGGDSSTMEEIHQSNIDLKSIKPVPPIPPSFGDRIRDIES